MLFRMAAEISCLCAAATFGLAIYEKALKPMPALSVRHDASGKSGAVAVVPGNAAPIIASAVDTQGLPCLKKQGYIVRAVETGPLPSYEFVGPVGGFEDACRSCNAHTVLTFTDVLDRSHQRRLDWYSAMQK